MKELETQKKKLAQKKNRIAVEETRLRLKERKARTRHLIELGGLVVKAELDFGARSPVAAVVNRILHV